MGGGRISVSWPFIAYLHVVTPVGFGAIAWWVSGHWTVRPDDPVTKRGEIESRLCTLLALLLVWSLLQTLWTRQFLLFGVLLIIYAALWKGGTTASVLLERRYRLIAARLSGETAFLVSLFLISLLSLFLIVYQATNGFTQFYEYFYGVYLNWARDLLAGRPVLSGEATGYWVFVAAVFRLSGESKVALQIVQIVINASIPLLGYFVARRLAPKEVARLAALILTFNFIHQWDAVNFHWSILVPFTRWRLSPPFSASASPAAKAVGSTWRSRVSPSVFWWPCVLRTPCLSPSSSGGIGGEGAANPRAPAS